MDGVKRKSIFSTPWWVRFFRDSTRPHLRGVPHGTLKCRPILLVPALRPVLSRNPSDEVGKRLTARLAICQRVSSPFSPQLAIARGREVAGPASHTTQSSPRGVPSHQWMREHGSTSIQTLQSIETVPDMTLTEHPSKSGGQGRLLGNHTYVMSGARERAPMGDVTSKNARSRRQWYCTTPALIPFYHTSMSGTEH
jgi:hypothetical protein